MSKNINLSGQLVLCQLFSFIPEHTISDAITAHKSDRYYKTISTRKQLAFILYRLSHDAILLKPMQEFALT